MTYSFGNMDYIKLPLYLWFNHDSFKGYMIVYTKFYQNFVLHYLEFFGKYINMTINYIVKYYNIAKEKVITLLNKKPVEQKVE
jgi:hypothetical protein